MLVASTCSARFRLLLLSSCLIARRGSATGTSVYRTQLHYRQHSARRAGSAAVSAARDAEPGMIQYPQPTVLPAVRQHSATVVLLHGLGDTAAGWEEPAAMLQAKLPHVKFVLPTAPMRSITLNMGMTMPGWFDITSLDKIHAQEDSAGLQDAARFVEGLVAAEQQAGIPSERVLVAGFSQGGAVALLALRQQQRLAGVLALSAWLTLAQDALVSDANRRTPLLMCHGNADEVVKYKYGKESYERLKQAGVPAEFKSYQGLGHGASPQELEDVAAFLQQQLPRKG